MEKEEKTKSVSELKKMWEPKQNKSVSKVQMLAQKYEDIAQQKKEEAQNFDKNVKKSNLPAPQFAKSQSMQPVIKMPQTEQNYEESKIQAIQEDVESVKTDQQQQKREKSEPFQQEKSKQILEHLKLVSQEQSDYYKKSSDIIRAYSLRKPYQNQKEDSMSDEEPDQEIKIMWNEVKQEEQTHENQMQAQQGETTSQEIQKPERKGSFDKLKQIFESKQQTPKDFQANQIPPIQSQQAQQNEQTQESQTQQQIYQTEQIQQAKNQQEQLQSQEVQEEQKSVQNIKANFQTSASQVSQSSQKDKNYQWTEEGSSWKKVMQRNSKVSELRAKFEKGMKD